MASKYSDIIKLRGGKAAYNISEEKEGEWTSFIPNEQFNNVLYTVLKSVRGNDIDNHKSFWVNGTYGTGKSHAVAVISHLLSDDVKDIKEWVDYEYGSERFNQLRNSIYSLRESKRLLTIKIYGLNAMTHPNDLGLVLQKAVSNTLWANDIDICVPTDYETYIDQINKNPEIWDHLIETKPLLSSIVENRNDLIDNLADNDLETFHRVSETLRDVGFDVRMDSNSVKQWFIEIQNRLRELGKFNGLLIIWDEFTDVMNNAIGLPVLKELQEIAETFMNEENDSYLFLISHPSAFDSVGSEQLKQTDGRYHRMKYNMESVSAFKIMSRKFEIIDKEKHNQMCNSFYAINPDLQNIFTQASNDVRSTREDLFNLFPLHPGTANLATHYATVIGSSSRSVFEFLGQNDAIRSFLESEENFLNRDTITPDYLWDYVLKVFQDDVTYYGAVTERFNSYVKQVSAKGDSYFAIFKGILLLNAFNNVSGENNNGLITPSEENIKYIFEGSKYADDVTTVLQWFNEEGIIQRAPGGLYSVEFSALPSGEIEEKKKEIRNVNFKDTYKILEYTDMAGTIFVKKIMQKVIRQYNFKFYSDIDNASALRSMIKNGRKNTKSSNYFFALLAARNNVELGKLKSFAEECAEDTNDKELQNIVFIVFDEVLGESKYEQFIEYQANYECASSHGFLDQQKVHRDHSIDMVKEWMESIQRNNATIYINGFDKQPISVKHLSSIINKFIVSMIYPYGPDAYEMLRQKAPSTFWKPQNSKEIVRKYLFSRTKEELLDVNAQMRPMQYLIQDCLDDNLEWKTDVSDENPFKAAFDKINSIIKHADKSVTFNLDEKFSLLTKPPYGFYGNYATMAMVAFALKPWVNKIYDPQGKPRDANGLVDDIVLLFKVWDDNKSNGKLNFKFQTPEEGKLCKDLISLFKLNSQDNTYSDVSSLKDARFAITGDFLVKKNAPLWSIKYAPDYVFSRLPTILTISDDIKQLIDNIVKICTEKDLRNPAVVNETLNLISLHRIEMKNILNVANIFTEGFKSYLLQLDLINAQEKEIDDIRKYIEQNLESTVGYWTEEEVEKTALRWRVSQQSKTKEDTTEKENTEEEDDDENDNANNHNEVINNKKENAKNRIKNLKSLEEAQAILTRLCECNIERILDIINR